MSMIPLKRSGQVFAGNILSLSILSLSEMFFVCFFDWVCLIRWELCVYGKNSREVKFSSSQCMLSMTGHLIPMCHW